MLKQNDKSIKYAILETIILINKKNHVNSKCYLQLSKQLRLIS